MRLKEWSDKMGINYQTAYRWFKNDRFPVPAYQTDSGTIIVNDPSLLEGNMDNKVNEQAGDVMSLFLKKTVEFSKSASSIEDFAAYILSNFKLKMSSSDDLPKYSKIKPKSEEVQKHFKQFINPSNKPKPEVFAAPPEAFNDDSNKEVPSAILTADSLKSLLNQPIPINYVDPNEPNFCASPDFNTLDSVGSAVTISGGFKPTQNEIDSISKAMEQVADHLRAEAKPKRGRTPSKNLGKKSL
jgi:hypothetical protein